MEIQDTFLMVNGEQFFVGDRITFPKLGRVSLDSIDYNELIIKVSNEHTNVTLKHTEFPSYMFFVKKIV